MGDRASVSFKNGKDESVVLFDHWGGQALFNSAVDYAEELIKEIGDKTCMPIERLEPDTVMVDFIMRYGEHHLSGGRIKSSLYLGATEHNGDNSDNGHLTIDLDVMRAEGRAKWEQSKKHF